MPEIENKFADRVEIKYYDTTDIVNYQLLYGLKQQYDPQLKIDLPVIFLNGRFISGLKINNQTLGDFIQRGLLAQRLKPAGFAKADLLLNFRNILPVTVAGAGLIDGVNPCAFTVIVFFMSFLALQGYRRRELVAIGLAFIFAVFATYLLIGLGLFGFLYKVSGFWAAVKIINYSIGIFSIALGILSIYDLIRFKKNRDAEGMILQLPVKIKQQIHRVIGLHYRAEKGGNRKRHIFNLIISAFITGFLISLLEAVCTGQTYLPTITFVFKSYGSFRLQAFLYLVLYNLMFVLPLFVIFVFAVFGVTSGQFSKFLKARLLLIKAMMAGLFFVLGLLLIWRA
jgi:cytochrome c biogenesis protein CcdA